MYFDIDNRYSESDWRADAVYRETQELARDRRDMEELTIESTPRETAGKLLRVGDYLSTAGWCDGSGFNEEYFDVDQTRAIRCSGCPACEEEQRTWAPIDEYTAGPAVEFCNDSPITIPERQKEAA